MSTEPTATPTTSLQPLLARLGTSGKVLALGAMVGVVAMFLPLVSFSVEMKGLGGQDNPLGKMMGNLGASHSPKVVDDWRGVVCLLGYIGAIILIFVLYPPKELQPKTLAWAGLGMGILLVLMALWLLFLAMDSKGADMGLGAFKVSIGFGGILNLLAAAAVSAGGFLKAREEKLV